MEKSGRGRESETDNAFVNCNSNSFCGNKSKVT